MKTEKIQEIINKISKGDFTCSDIGLLFVWLRPCFFKDQILWDLSNFIAHHSEGRDRGVSFDHIHSFVENFLSVSERGGKIPGLPPVFRRNDVMQRLLSVLKNLKLQFEDDKLIAQKDSLVECLQKLIEETEFKFNEPRIIRCYVKRLESRMLFCIEADLKGPVIKMSPGASVCSNLFD